MDRYAAKYRDRGLVIVGLQVRREPEILTENVIFWLERIRPTIPVFCRGWNPEWPTRTLPWVMLFDHEGREVFAGKPERAEPAIAKALAAAPHPVIGGPYRKRKADAEQIISDRILGTHLGRLRADEDPDDEVRAMIAAAEHWFERRAARIEDQMPGVVEQAEAWDVLAGNFAGDPLGERAASARDSLRSTLTFAAEEAAETALRRARATFRRCPTHGGYFPYHFTRIIYTVIEDPAWVATRVRMLAEFRLELGRIVATYPDTYAAEEASDLLFLHDAVELSLEAARERVERAERLLTTVKGPAQLYEAWLLLVEVSEGYLDSDEVSARAAELLASLSKDQAKELVAAETEARALREEAALLQREALRGGSLLSRERANEIMTRLSELAARSGEDTALARQISAQVAELARSFEGSPRVGVRLDARFPGPGARIALVEPGTGAALAGLLAGDVVLKLGDTTLSGVNDFTKALADSKPGERVSVEVQRASGEVETLEVVLGRRLPRR